MWAFRTSIILLMTGTLLAQQHSYTPVEIQDGKLLFDANCGNCHGADGNAITGAEVGLGRFRHANSDEDLVNLIRTGIPGTAMPPHTFNDTQLGTVVAFLRNMSAPGAAATTNTGNAPAGNAARGQAIFEGKGQCLNCHSVKGVGSRLGPNLTQIGATRPSAVEIQRSIVDPGAEIRAENRFFRAVTQRGVTSTGRLLNQDTFSIQLMDSGEQLVSLMKSNLREYGPVATPMPSYGGRLTAQELIDLVSYLVSLR